MVQRNPVKISWCCSMWSTQSAVSVFIGVHLKIDSRPGREVKTHQWNVGMQPIGCTGIQDSTIQCNTLQAQAPVAGGCTGGIGETGKTEETGETGETDGDRGDTGDRGGRGDGRQGRWWDGGDRGYRGHRRHMVHRADRADWTERANSFKTWSHWDQAQKTDESFKKVLKT